MRLLEWEAKALLKAEGIAIPDGIVVRTADEAGAAAQKLGGEVALKVQIPSGRRMKAGGVRFATTPAEAAMVAADLLLRELLGHTVSSLLVESRAPQSADRFLAITYDTNQKAPIILGSAAGGVDVEQTTASTGSAPVRQVVDMAWPFSAYRGRELAAAMGLTGPELLALGDAVRRLYSLFSRFDATLVEINPLAWIPGKGYCALDAHIELEDESLGRHSDLLTKFGIQLRPSHSRPPTAFELGATRIDAADHRGVAGRVVEFGGNLGLLIGGGGASLTVFDAILAHGGKPANYCEIGGNPSVGKIRNLTKLILSRPGVRSLAVIMNVVSNTRVDLVARGVIKGAIELGLDPKEVISVFRIPGAWEDEGAKILHYYGIPFCDRTVSLDEAARLAVERSQT